MPTEQTSANPIEERAVRLEKLGDLRTRGIDPFPARSPVVGERRPIARLLDEFESLTRSGERVVAAGRIKAVRAHGGAVFADLEDEGQKIQVHLREDVVGATAFELFNRDADHGDFIAVAGKCFLTRRGEKSIEAAEWGMLAKALRPLPAKWHGLADTEIRYRKRYLDLIANPETRGLFLKRGAVIRAIREFFEKEGFIEVETPVLQTIPGGADARPFVTRHNALGLDMYLRIAPELYLKRCVAGGLNKVYEIARCFRNEGIDHLHNPEFTQVEFYQAYADYRDLMTLAERFLPWLAEKINGKLAVEQDGKTMDLTPPYPRMTFKEALRNIGGFDLSKYPDRESLADAAARAGVTVEPLDGRGRILDNLYKKLVRPRIINPTFILDYPTEMLPLAKRVSEDRDCTESFQLLMAGGMELLKAFTELNDPLDQRARFEEQEKLRAAGDEEAQRIDEDYLEALETGLPPTAGCGIGVDRLVALLTGSHSIKEVILFPTMRPLGTEGSTTGSV